MSIFERSSQAHTTKKIVIAALLLLLLWLIIWYRSSEVQSLVEALTPPDLPRLQVINDDGKWLPQCWVQQNWGNVKAGTSSPYDTCYFDPEWEAGDRPKMSTSASTYQISSDTQRYHHINQGTRTLPIPYSWLVNLEQPKTSLFGVLFLDDDKLIDNEYLLRFGFIRSNTHPDNNPDGLPIGFSKSSFQNVPGLAERVEAIGFTCAACHTGHMIFDKGDGPVEYVIEGGPAMVDLGLFTKALGAALGQTLLSSKVPVFNGRFDRFARNVLGERYSALTKSKLSSQLEALVEASAKTADIIDVTEGFTRLDALNRIGNQVFAKGIDRPDNYAPIDAPVNYPHIWTASWFDWVQYDASIMGPLVRNAGEALGVNAFLDTTSPLHEGRFDSSIPMSNLVWLENFLAGKSPEPNNPDAGLQAPPWVFTELDPEKIEVGRKVYQSICQDCHLPVLTSQEIFKNEKYFAPITYTSQPGFKTQTQDKTLQLKVITIKQVGTDPAQANVLVNRTIDTSGDVSGPRSQYTKGVGIDYEICVRDPNELEKQSEDYIKYAQLSGQDTANAYKGKEKGYGRKGVDLINFRVEDSGDVSFGLALGAIVAQTIEQWFKQNGISDEAIKEFMQGGRPNCIQAGAGYKARPLNGVWATAPFLHNGSVPAIADLLCPTDGVRPEYVQLGSLAFDPDKLGIAQPENYQEKARDALDDGQTYDEDGYFILDTSIPGNFNTGHRFSDEYDASKHYLDQPKGVIGRKLTPEECEGILEYLKSPEVN